jgi:restriction system protein
MARNWIIAPVESKRVELFDRVWAFDLENGLISIGWRELGDVSQMSRSHLAAKVASTFSDRPPQTKALIANMMWAFFHELAEGDRVLARRGRKTLAAVGIVSGRAWYEPGKSPVHGHPNFIPVAWQDAPRDKVFPEIVFPMHTLAERPDDLVRSLIEGEGSQTVVPEPPLSSEDRNAFVLEKYLEEFIVSNFEAIFKGGLKIYEDDEGNGGQQYDTDIGPIDILAYDPTSGSFVVIELKKGRPSDQVVGQILRYMGWVKKNVANGRTVKGLIICSEPDPKLSYALDMTAGIDVRYYSVSFKLSEAP